MIEAVTKCPACGAPVRQGDRGRRRIYCSAACRKAAHRARSAAWRVLNEPDEGVPSLAASLADAIGPHHAHSVPAPDESREIDVAASILAASAVAAEFRRHSVAAPPTIACRCAQVATAIEEALDEQFGEVFA